MKFNAVLTKEQAKEMFAYLEDIFTEVKVLDIEAVRRLEKDKNSISLKAFRERCQKKRLEYVESRVYQRIARYVEIEGEPYVVEMLNVLGTQRQMQGKHWWQKSGDIMKNCIWMR